MIVSFSGGETLLPKFRYLRAETIDEALNFLDDYGREARILAGGTDLLIAMRDGAISPKYLIDVKNIPELHGISLKPNGNLSLGACTTINEVLQSENLPDDMRAIREAASALATYQVRNRATVAGNLCNASPACDLGAPLLVLDAKLRVLSRKGERLIPLSDFFTGVKMTCCEPCELVAEVMIPVLPARVSGFLKRGRIRGHDLALVNAAAAVEEGGPLRLALGAVGPTPLLIDDFDGVGPGDEDGIIEIVDRSILPIDDVRGSSRYRRHMAEFLVRKLLDLLRRRMEGS